jgi:hypothetical protein
MCDRQNTIVCAFDPRSPRITAYQIHEWIYEQLTIQEDTVRMIQIDGPRRRVFIKFVDEEKMQDILRTTQGQLEYHHENGELSLVQIERVCMSVRYVRIANLPPEVPDRILRDSMSTYGEVKAMKEESCSRAYRYAVSNGIRIVEISLKKHIPSHMTIAGNIVLLSYEG